MPRNMPWNSSYFALALLATLILQGQSEIVRSDYCSCCVDASYCETALFYCSDGYVGTGPEQCCQQASCECASHSACSSDEYCDVEGDCYTCYGCSEFNDPIDGTCPSKCAPGSGRVPPPPSSSCSAHRQCASDEYCDDTGSCYRCNRLEDYGNDYDTKESLCYYHGDPIDDVCPDKCGHEFNLQEDCDYGDDYDYVEQYFERVEAARRQAQRIPGCYGSVNSDAIELIPDCTCHRSCFSCGFGSYTDNSHDCIKCKDDDFQVVAKFCDGTGVCEAVPDPADPVLATTDGAAANGSTAAALLLLVGAMLLAYA